MTNLSEALDRNRQKKLRALDTYINSNWDRIPEDIRKDLLDILACGEWNRD